LGPDRSADRLRLLVAELEDELARIARLRGELDHARQAVDAPVSDTLVVYGAAALLESFYTGMEKAMRRIAMMFGGMPQGDGWHRDLLASMTLALEGLRPAVLRAETVKALDPYLAFRHRFRNLYVFDNERAPMLVLLGRAADAERAFDADVRAFVAELRQGIAALDA